ncbi:MAG: outer membrane protein, partial [Psychromonas sp.]
MAIKQFSIAALFALSSYSYSVSADTLLQVYQTAKIKDPIILKSKAQYDVFKEQVTESKASLLPQIGFGLEANRVQSSNDSLTNTNYGAGLSLTQSIYNGSYWQQA